MRWRYFIVKGYDKQVKPEKLKLRIIWSRVGTGEIKLGSVRQS
jgi:hypothetical protein